MEDWALRNWCFQTVLLDKTLESPLEFKEIQPVHPKKNQSWIFIGGTDIEAETPTFWPPDVKNWFIWKTPDAGKDWRQEEKGTTEDEMVGWHYHLDGHEFEQAVGVGDGQGNLVCYSPWGCKELDMIEWTELSDSLETWCGDFNCNIIKISGLIKYISNQLYFLLQKIKMNYKQQYMPVAKNRIENKFNSYSEERGITYPRWSTEDLRNRWNLNYILKKI